MQVASFSICLWAVQLHVHVWVGLVVLLVGELAGQVAGPVCKVLLLLLSVGVTDN